MDRIALEIAAMIVENLVEYDLGPGPYWEYSEIPGRHLCCGSYDWEDRRPPWIVLTEDTRPTIFNARLSCQKLYAASTKSFATLLGERVFCFTKAGTDDLRAIGNCPRLTPYITTLTIGRTGLRVPAAEDALQSLLSPLDAPDQDRLKKTYKESVNWQITNLPHVQDRLASLFRAFPNLDGIRITSKWRPYPLVPWLSIQDAKMFHRGYCIWKEDDVLDQYHESCGRDTLVYDIQNHRALSSTAITQALVQAKATMTDLRVFDIHPEYLFTQEMVFANLRTLRITVPVYRTIVGRPTPLQPVEMLAKVIVAATSLQDLALNALLDYVHTAPILTALEDRHTLRCIQFTGRFDFEEDELLEFVAHHSQNLRCLIFEGSSLYGSWPAALRTIGHLTKDRLEFFWAFWVKQWDPELDVDRDFTEAQDFELTDDDLAGFSCPCEVSAHPQDRGY
ncbi:hypothetical protein FB567DRAFT_603724 [Paraphoma chrysanthemicola]|uniref:Uncharacterized protein n=1 Tax=Paraphoma chrysanthemicola TaxID=798071 RepID=A0A8K0R368_9PLEO|nr:hypothetical protein FB567DRAFT_603724 [Paraphoma chrysanthemicola]